MDGLLAIGPTRAAAEELRKQRGSKGLLAAVGEPLSYAPGPLGLLGNALLAAQYATGEKSMEDGLASLSDMTAMLVGSRLPPPLLAAVKAGKITVEDAIRKAYPGVYKDPRVIAEQANAKLAAEDPALKRLFGVTRDDLFQMSSRQGNMEGVIPGAPVNPKGSAAAEKVMTQRNADRLVSTLQEGQRIAPELMRGMGGWYVMDPAYERMVTLLGPEKAKEMYMRMNAFSGIESPNMPVSKEITRGTAANWLAEQGRWDDWVKWGGMKNKGGLLGVPEDMVALPGRVGHKRASKSQGIFMDTGDRYGGMNSPKAPAYIDASGVPAVGFQTDLPVGDAHWSRAMGLADVRTNKEFGASVSTPEILALKDWFRTNVADPVGLQPVPAQASLWGLFAPQTGVKTAIGAPKLELLAKEIMATSDRLNVSPERARDLVLTGMTYAGR